MNDKSEDAGAEAVVDERANDETKFRVRIGVRTQGDLVAKVHARVVVSSFPNVQWGGWSFEGGAIHFVNANGCELRVPLATADAQSITGLYVLGQTIGLVQRHGRHPTALLWACVIEALAQMQLADAEPGGELAAERLSADLLATARAGGMS